MDSIFNDRSRSSMEDRNLSVRFISNVDNRSSNAVDEDDQSEDEIDFYNYNNNENDAADVNMNFADSDYHVRKSTGGGDGQRLSTVKTKIIYENTYRMEPKPDQFFVSYKVKAFINAQIGPIVDSFEYESGAAATLCKNISQKVVMLVRKKFDWPRYRYVCNVTVVQIRKQGLLIADRSLWFPPIDNCAVWTFQNKKVAIIVTIHAIYYE